MARLGIARTVVVGVMTVGGVAPVALGSSFPRGSLMLGDVGLHSESRAAHGIVTSHVPSMSRIAGAELLVSFRPGAKVAVEHYLRSVRGVRAVGALIHLPVVLVRVVAHNRRRAIAALRSLPGVE